MGSEGLEGNLGYRVWVKGLGFRVWGRCGAYVLWFSVFGKA